MTQQVQVLVLGVLLGGVFALMASGLTLLFGVMRVINLAHGAFIILGAYISFFAFRLFRIDPFVSILITMPALFLLGIVVYKTLFPRVARSPRYVEMTVLASFALALIVEGAMGYIFTGIYRTSTPSYATQSFLIGPIFVPKGQLFAAATSVVLLGLLWAFLYHTRSGYAARATMQNRTAAQIVGVNVERISTLAFGLGLAMAGASGALVSFLFTFFPAEHWRWISTLLALIVLGGLGSLKGALVGALLLSVVSGFAANAFGPTWSPLTFFLALFVVLLVRPQGLFGKKLEV